MKAAINFKFGSNDPNARPKSFKIGSQVPEDIANQVPDHCILEKVAEEDPEQLSRDQLLILAGIGSEGVDDLEPITYDEEELREGLRVLRTKSEVMEWFEEVRPDNNMLDKATQSRAEMEDIVILELMGDPEEYDPEDLEE